MESLGIIKHTCMSVKTLIKHAVAMEVKYAQTSNQPAANVSELQVLRATMGEVYKRIQQLELRVNKLEQSKQ